MVGIQKSKKIAKEKICENPKCRKLFLTKATNAKYCSEDCRRAVYFKMVDKRRKLARRIKEEKIKHKCRVCGTKTINYWYCNTCLRKIEGSTRLDGGYVYGEGIQTQD